jgi:hypothetical protein
MICGATVDDSQNLAVHPLLYRCQNGTVFLVPVRDTGDGTNERVLSGHAMMSFMFNPTSSLATGFALLSSIAG